MNKLQKALVLIGLGCLSNFGCATKVTTTDMSQLGEVKTQATGFLLAYNFSAEDFIVGDNECVLEFKNADDNSHIRLDVRYGKNKLLAETKPGIYYFHDFNCGRYTWDINSNTVPRFKVIESKISLTVPIVIKITDRRRIHFNYYNRQVTQEQSLALWGSLSDHSKANLISGYTLAPITLELINDTQLYNTTEVSSDGVKFKSIKRSQFKSFRSCYESEQSINGLPLGRVEVDVSFGDSFKIDIGKKNHSFSNQFVECVKSEISRFDNSEKKFKKAHLIF